MEMITINQSVNIGASPIFDTVTVDVMNAPTINTSNLTATNATITSANIPSLTSTGITTTTLDAVAIGATDILTTTLTAGDKITSNGYLVSGFQPAISPEGGAGSGASVSLEAGSTDNAGTVILTTGSGASSYSELFTISLNLSMSNYFVVVTNGDKDTGHLILYAYQASSTKWQMASSVTPSDFTTYRFNYILLGQP